MAQDLYEKKLTTYPRTDARVLSSAVAKEIGKNISRLKGFEPTADFVEHIMQKRLYANIADTQYTDDSKVTDHYAIIPTGQLTELSGLTSLQRAVFELIVRRFLSIFYPPAVYQKLNVTVKSGEEHFFTSTKVLVEEGFLPVTQYSFTKKKNVAEIDMDAKEDQEETFDLKEVLGLLKKDTPVQLQACHIKEGETSPPKRYNSGSMILAMENAGQLIEDEELRAQIKGSGIGTSATRAKILKKLFNIGYLNLNKKTQIITPALKGELVFGIVRYSMPQMLSPKLTASWEKGLTGVAEGNITEEEYMVKLDRFIEQLVSSAKSSDHRGRLDSFYRVAAPFYKTKKSKTKK